MGLTVLRVVASRVCVYIREGEQVGVMFGVLKPPFDRQAAVPLSDRRCGQSRYPLPVIYAESYPM